MSDWVDIQHWTNCASMSSPGYVFEVVNAQGQSLRTPCVQPLQTPWDWTSAPVRFRLVREAPPRRSTPIPGPAQR